MELSDLGARAGLEWRGQVTGVSRNGGRWAEVVAIMSKWSSPHEQSNGIKLSHGGMVSLVLMNCYRLSGIREKMELSELGARTG